jgi:hypothetical protein
MQGQGPSAPPATGRGAGGQGGARVHSVHIARNTLRCMQKLELLPRPEACWHTMSTLFWIPCSHDASARSNYMQVFVGSTFMDGVVSAYREGCEGEIVGDARADPCAPRCKRPRYERRRGASTPIGRWSRSTWTPAVAASAASAARPPVCSCKAHATYARSPVERAR